MNRIHLSLLIGLNTALLTCSAYAQLPRATPKVLLDDSSDREKTAAKAEADRLREGRRSQARSLLLSLSNEARGFSDQQLRARSLTRIADALWDVAAEQGRMLFREAWAAAVKADQESDGNTDIRRTVLATAAKHDRQLAEEFLQKLVSAQEENGAGLAAGNATSGNNLWRLPEAGEKRLSLAQNLLSTGDVARALQFADPALGAITMSTVSFLSRLRERDAPAADRRFAAMLANAGADALADANTVSVLSSYIFSPHTYVVFNSEGAADAVWMNSPYPPADVEPQLRLTFFQTAGGIFLRPQPPAGQNPGALSVAGKYSALKRLLPLFRQYAPPDVTGSMQALFESLGAQVSEDVRQRKDEMTQKGLASEGSSAEQERSLLGEVEDAKTSDERDQLYFRLALLALGANDAKALDYVGKIDDGSFREQARAWVEWGLILKAVEKKKPEATLELARDAKLTHVQQVWVLTQSAKLLAKTDRDRALSLIEKAKSEARLIARDDMDRPRGLLAVANALRQADPPQAWAAISDAVEAANWIEDFTGEGGEIIQHLSSKAQIMEKREAVPDFDISGLFGGLASTDLDRAVLSAQTFKREATRANAVIAVAQSVLNEKSAPAPAPQRASKK
jgi:hypothetical protein